MIFFKYRTIGINTPDLIHSFLLGIFQHLKLPPVPPHYKMVIYLQFVPKFPVPRLIVCNSIRWIVVLIYIPRIRCFFNLLDTEYIGTRICWLICRTNHYFAPTARRISIFSFDCLSDMTQINLYP
jgi:hypothetical protein